MQDHKSHQPVAGAVKHRPSEARQHVTAGPYSPVLVVNASRFIVISGQVAVNTDGSVIGSSIEEQAEATLANCASQLASAGCTLADVFKVNVFMDDLAEWERFNAVYARHFIGLRPVRTAIGCKLLPGFKVEIELWAALA